jgi:hypothetical protein
MTATYQCFRIEAYVVFPYYQTRFTFRSLPIKPICLCYGEIKMSFVILKLSYKEPGDNGVIGGVCGSGFFINESTGVTANHVLNDNTFKPNTGNKYCQVWLLTRNNKVYPIERDSIYSIPGLDTCVINLPYIIDDADIYSLSLESAQDNQEISSLGYIGNQMPQISASWNNSILQISGVDLSSVISDKEGGVLERKVMTVQLNSAILIPKVGELCHKAYWKNSKKILSKV